MKNKTETENKIRVLTWAPREYERKIVQNLPCPDVSLQYADTHQNQFIHLLIQFCVGFLLQTLGDRILTIILISLFSHPTEWWLFCNQYLK